MRVVAVIAVNVFKESVRDKVLYNLVLFAVLMIGASLLIGQLTAGQDVKMIKDLGLAAIALFGLFIAVFIGIGLVWKEVDRKSVYALLAKPISRRQLILGKYLGLIYTLTVNVALMAIAFYATLAFTAWKMAALLPPTVPVLDPRLLEAIGLILLELWLVTAIALFFSSFSTPILSAAFTFGLYLVGHFDADLKHFEDVVASAGAAWMARAIYYLLPNLAAFDIKSQAVHGLPVAASYLGLTAAYAAVYIAILLVASIWIFGRRDLK